MKNIRLGKLPLACQTDPAGTACVNAGVYYLDEARAKLGESPYQLPADFPYLGSVRQLFILTNLDRIQSGLPPMTGLTTALNHDAYVKGVKAEADPSPTDPTDEIHEWTSNWSGGFANAPLAYHEWMYDDGLGSANIDCTDSHKAGCWEHRHNVLWRFDPSDVLAMGAASGNSPDGPSYVLLLVGGFPPDPDYGDPGYTPTYSYTWSEAVADGAGSNAYDPGVPDTTICKVPNVVGRTLASAKEMIAASHCAVGRVVHKRTAHSKRSVIAQRPEPGAKLAVGSKIRLTVGRGSRR